MKNKGIVITVGAVVAVIALLETACARNEGNGMESKSSEAGIVTNDNGSVSRTYVESSVTTNGNMVTEHRRETRTTLDTEGNMLATTTSEYAQSYPVGDVWVKGDNQNDENNQNNRMKEGEEKINNDSFMGLKFGEVFTPDGAGESGQGEADKNAAFIVDNEEPTLLRAKFTPKKPLAGFDDYYVFVTPTTHKVAKVYACAKEVVEPGARWRRHYLIEALEKRYQTWARLCSFSRPCYAFDLGDSRYVTACLAGASRGYETILTGWDENVLAEAAEETAAIREAARKTAAEKRANRVNEAAEAF